MTDDKKFSLSKGYEELEKLAADFEGRELDLDKDIPKFERGMELAQKLRKHLKQTDNKIVEIIDKFKDDES